MSFTAANRALANRNAVKNQNKRESRFKELDAMGKVKVPRSGNGWPKGVKIYGRASKTHYGRATGAQYACNLEGCSGRRVSVLWPAGYTSRLCTKSLERYKDGWRLV